MVKTEKETHDLLKMVNLNLEMLYHQSEKTFYLTFVFTSILLFFTITLVFTNPSTNIFKICVGFVIAIVIIAFIGFLIVKGKIGKDIHYNENKIETLNKKYEVLRRKYIRN